MLAGSGVVGQALVGGWGLSRSGGRSKGQGGGRWDTELTGDIDQPSSRHATLPQPQISSISCRLSRCRYCCSNLLFFSIVIFTHSKPSGATVGHNTSIYSTDINTETIHGSISARQTHNCYQILRGRWRLQRWKTRYEREML